VPTGVPHLWQNLAPGVRSAWQVAHFPPASAAPHSLQNLPRADAPQLGQVIVVSAMDTKVRNARRGREPMESVT